MCSNERQPKDNNDDEEEEDEDEDDIKGIGNYDKVENETDPGKTPSVKDKEQQQSLDDPSFDDKLSPSLLPLSSPTLFGGTLSSSELTAAAAAAAKRRSLAAAIRRRQRREAVLLKRAAAAQRRQRQQHEKEVSSNAWVRMIIMAKREEQ